MDAQDETKEKLSVEEERLKQNENEGVRLPCDYSTERRVGHVTGGDNYQ
jgi:hypothetical protein